LAFAVIIATTSAHALLTVSHDVPVYRLSPVSAFAERSTNLQSKQTSLRGRTALLVRANDRAVVLFIAIVAATP
jgi:hypothetical protein